MTDFPADRTLRIGTRSSPMALAQTEYVTTLLLKLAPELHIEAVPITTEADKWQGDLAQLGGKGLFVKAIDQQLQRGEVDMAIHCLKDVPGDQPMPEGLVFAAMLPRDDVRDVLLVPADSPVTKLDDLAAGAAVATTSVRRKAQVLAVRPDLNVIRVRGAIGSRIEKLDGSKGDLQADAMIVARAGLERLGLAGRIVHQFTVQEILPAVGSGVLALECRRDDPALAGLLEQLNHERTQTEATAERVMLHGLRGHCNSPIAGYCTTEPDGQLSLRGMVFSRDGSKFAHAHIWGEADNDPRHPRLARVRRTPAPGSPRHHAKASPTDRDYRQARVPVPVPIRRQRPVRSSLNDGWTVSFSSNRARRRTKGVDRRAPTTRRSGSPNVRLRNPRQGPALVESVGKDLESQGRRTVRWVSDACWRWCFSDASFSAAALAHVPEEHREATDQHFETLPTVGKTESVRVHDDPDLIMRTGAMPLPSSGTRCSSSATCMTRPG
ncbi:hydroxymethylbilane synthase [Streptomyces sp. ODS28]|uniref:hydroxymethylbilane synthase n=1 Tax=Streptomyces sp. ODS28 TaxID=3136688 RepID=UPI0031EDFA33